MRKSDLHEEHFVFVQGAVCANPCPTGTYHLDCRFPSSSSLLTSFSSHNHQSLHIVCRKFTFVCRHWYHQRTACCFENAPRERCDCYNGAHCDHVNGQCHCLPGYKGEKVNLIPGPGLKYCWMSLFQCQEQCPYGRWGHNCQQHCQCQHGGRWKTFQIVRVGSLAGIFWLTWVQRIGGGWVGRNSTTATCFPYFKLPNNLFWGHFEPDIIRYESFEAKQTRAALIKRGQISQILQKEFSDSRKSWKQVCFGILEGLSLTYFLSRLECDDL